MGGEVDVHRCGVKTATRQWRTAYAVNATVSGMWKQVFAAIEDNKYTPPPQKVAMFSNYGQKF